MGDSITQGYLEPTGNSYRRDLECLLFTGGNGVQYIGSQTSGNWEDSANDGFDGQRILQIRNLSNAEIVGTPSANIVLIHAGTNDMIQNYAVDGAPARLGTLIDTVYRANPSVLILVAKIIVNNDTAIQSRISDFNEAIPDIVSARSDAGTKVRLVDMESVTVDDLIEGTHPNANGYAKMATVWYQGIVQAGTDGLISAPAGDFVNRGKSSMPSDGGSCSALT
jgi:lysophospholipase L1-like esterase